MSIRVVINGALGKMGQAVGAGLAKAPGLEVVGGADIAARASSYALSATSPAIPLARSVDELLGKVQANVLVDFSRADATLPAVRAAASRKVSFVVGTTGHPPDVLKALEALTAEHGVGGMVAPNFALGAVLMMHLSQQAAKYFEYAEIIELHHEEKIDAPSGTAKATAEMMGRARGKPFKRNVPEKESVRGARDAHVDGITIHSVRLPGQMAHQEVIFGIAGQTLRIRHDQIDRNGFLPGIEMAVRHVAAHKGFVFGLDTLMGL